MLSWSARETGRTVDIAGIVDDSADPGVPGGRELVAMARSVTRPDAGPELTDAVAARIGQAAALDAVAVAANFQIMNRVVDATGVPFPKSSRDQMSDAISTLGLESFPHAGLE